MVGGLMVLIIFAVVWGFRIMRLTDFTDAVAREMAAGHRSQDALPYRAPAFSDLAALMPRLSFHPVFPKGVGTQAQEVFGARYCSILGRSAVQIRMKNTEGVFSSLFQTPVVPSDPRFDAYELIGEGVRVRLWQQDGLLMGLVRDQ
jgi:hypothetical protein